MYKHTSDIMTRIEMIMLEKNQPDNISIGKVVNYTLHHPNQQLPYQLQGS